MIGPSEVVLLMTTKPEAEYAAEMKKRLTEALAAVMPLFDEAAANGLSIQWDSIAPQAPRFRHGVNGLRLVKVY